MLNLAMVPRPKHWGAVIVAIETPALHVTWALVGSHPVQTPFGHLKVV